MKKQKKEELIGLFEKELEYASETEKEINCSLERMDKPFVETGDWKKDYQKIAELEKNAEKIIEKANKLAQTPVGLEDSLILLRKHCEEAKDVLMAKKPLREKDMRGIEVSRKNLASRIKEFSENLAEKEKKTLAYIAKMAEENRKMTEKIERLEAENKRLKSKLKDKAKKRK